MTETLATILWPSRRPTGCDDDTCSNQEVVSTRFLLRAVSVGTRVASRSNIRPPRFQRTAVLNVPGTSCWSRPVLRTRSNRIPGETRCIKIFLSRTWLLQVPSLLPSQRRSQLPWQMPLMRARVLNPVVHMIKAHKD